MFEPKALQESKENTREKYIYSKGSEEKKSWDIK